MISPTTVSAAFIKWMEDNSYGTFGTDIYLNHVKSQAIDNVYWVISSGGDVSAKNVTPQNRKQYLIQVNYRNVNSQEVEDRLFALEEKINTPDCFNLEGFEIYSIESSMVEDNGKDAENRPQGLLTVTIEIYRSYVT